MNPPLLTKIRHRFTHNAWVNRYLIPWIKLLLCYRQNQPGRTSSAFKKSAKKVKLKDETSFKGDSKLLVCGLPKSGNTWLCNFLAVYFDQPQIHPFLDKNASGIAMNHFFPGKDILYRKDILRCFYIIRDLRDILCSYYHYAKTPYHLNEVNANFNPGYSLEDFYFKYFLKVLVDRYRWFENIQAYEALGVSVVRYEDLLQDTEGEFRRLLTEAGVDVDEARLKRAIEQTSFKSLRSQGQHTISSEKTTLTPVSKSHFRKGRAGGWKDELTQPVVEDIARRFGPLLRSYGYSA